MIYRMQKLLLAGPQKNKESALTVLQNSGIVETQPFDRKSYKVDGRQVSTSAADTAISAVKILDRYAVIGEREKILKGSYIGDIEKLVDEIPLLDIEYKKIKEDQVLTTNKMKFLEPWGVFSISKIKEIEKNGNLHIQFWDVSQKVASQVKTEGAIAEVVIFSDNERKYFLTFSEKPLKLRQCIEVNYDMDQIELKKQIEDLTDKEMKLLKKLVDISSIRNDLFKHYLKKLNEVNFNRTAKGTAHILDDALFFLQAWCPVNELENLKKALENENVTMIPIEPEQDERIPTLMHPDSKTSELGGDLVNIYDTPSYADWDPSSWLFFSFVFFFAMIMADGGYGLVLFCFMVYLKIKLKKPVPAMKRFIDLSLVLSGTTMIYGLLVGGFFGINIDTPAFEVLAPLTGFLRFLRNINTSDNATMMLVSILVGMVHICISLILKSVRLVFDNNDYVNAIINILWIAAIWAFYFWYKYDGVAGAEYLTQGGMTGMKICGALLVVFYGIAAKSYNPIKIFMSSFFGLYNGVQFFSDVLSYIRIFALGLSGALLAQTFNNLSFDLWNGGIAGMVLAPFIFLLGHILNIALSIMSGVIHGLRLNFLEWYRWSFDGGGKRFVPFKDLLKTYAKGEN